MTDERSSIDGGARESMRRRRFITRGGTMAAAATAGVVGATALSASPAAAATSVPVLLPVGPIRVYDSRTPGEGRIYGGQTLRLSGDGAPPEIADLYNLTVTSTAANGYLAIYPGDEVYNGTSSINWYASGQTLGNNVYTAIDQSDGGINVRCGAGSTHFVIDLVGALLPYEVAVAAEGGVAAAGLAGRRLRS